MPSRSLSHFLMGHAREGVSAKHIAELIIANGPALRKAQEKISRRVFELLGLTLCGHHDAPLAPDAPNRVASTRKKEQSRRAGSRSARRLSRNTAHDTQGHPWGFAPWERDCRCITSRKG
jgi:hypothetical protein